MGNKSDRIDRRFFDPRPPGPRRKNGAEMCAAFNAQHSVGTAIQVFPLARWLLDVCKERASGYCGQGARRVHQFGWLRRSQDPRRHHRVDSRDHLASGWLRLFLSPKRRHVVAAYVAIATVEIAISRFDLWRAGNCRCKRPCKHNQRWNSVNSLQTILVFVETKVAWVSGEDC
jgi:hypothetical protein